MGYDEHHFRNILPEGKMLADDSDYDYDDDPNRVVVTISESGWVGPASPYTVWRKYADGHWRKTEVHPGMSPNNSPWVRCESPTANERRCTTTTHHE